MRLIQVKYPSLTQNIIRLKAPHDMAAIFLRKSKNIEFVDKGKIYIYYITPCAAKIVATRAPVGEDKFAIDSTFNMTEVFNITSSILLAKKNQGMYKIIANMSPDSVNWSLSGTKKSIF